MSVGCLVANTISELVEQIKVACATVILVCNYQNFNFTTIYKKDFAEIDLSQLNMHEKQVLYYIWCK